MKLSEIVKDLQLEVSAGSNLLEVDVVRGYISDLMSDVMANAKEGDLWVTLQTHQNVVAVAVMKSISGIILINGRQPQEETVQKAVSQGVPLMISDLPAFELVGRLFQMGISGI